MRRSQSKLQVFLNVYDIHDYNHYGYPFGIGAFHTGVEVAGKEFAFGGHDRDISGVFVTEPRCVPNARFRESIFMGETEMTISEIRRASDELGDDFIGSSYDLLRRNCNHFSDAFCQRIVNRQIPRHINRLAWWGSVFSCLLPASLGLQPPPATIAAGSAAPPPFTAFGGTGVTLSGSATSVPSLHDAETPREDADSCRKRLADAAARRLEGPQVRPNAK